MSSEPEAQASPAPHIETFLAARRTFPPAAPSSMPSVRAAGAAGRAEEA